MNREELMAKIAEWIGEITDEAPPTLSADTDLVQDLGLDSLALAELAAKLRVALKIKLRPGEFRQDMRVGYLLDVVLSRLPA